jgi:reactive intermediate/imine deaminase
VRVAGVKEIISTDEAAGAVGAYSQGTTNGDLLFTAGQIALTPDGELLDDADIETQTERALDNLTAIIEEGGGSFDDILKTTVFLADIDDFDRMNEVYGSYFGDEPPARSAVQAGALPAGVDVEIEAVVSLE